MKDKVAIIASEETVRSFADDANLLRFVINSPNKQPSGKVIKENNVKLYFQLLFSSD